MNAVATAVEVLGFDPFSATPGRTIDSITRAVFRKLSVPCFLEAGIKQSFDMFDRYRVSSTTLWRHLLRIRQGKLKAPPEA